MTNGDACLASGGDGLGIFSVTACIGGTSCAWAKGSFSGTFTTIVSMLDLLLFVVMTDTPIFYFFCNSICQKMVVTRRSGKKRSDKRKSTSLAKLYKKRSKSAELCDSLKKGSKQIQITNPITGRLIKVSGPTYKKMRQGCKGCKPDRTECDRLKKNSGINPFTGRRLGTKTAAWRNIEYGCSSCIARIMATPPDRPTIPSRKRLPSTEEEAAAEQVQGLLATTRAQKSQKGAVVQMQGLMRMMPYRKQWVPTYEAIKRQRDIEQRTQKQREEEDSRKETRKMFLLDSVSKGIYPDLMENEVESLLFDCYRVSRDRNVNNEVISLTPTSNMDVAVQQVQNNIRDGGYAIIFAHNHYAALHVIRTETGGYSLEYFEPYNKMTGPYGELKKLLIKLNPEMEKKKKKKQSDPTLKRYYLNWQKEPGPCGVYAAFAVKYLFEGDDLRKKDVAKELDPPIVAITDAYRWIAENAPSSAEFKN